LSRSNKSYIFKIIGGFKEFTPDPRFKIEECKVVPHDSFKIKLVRKWMGVGASSGVVHIDTDHMNHLGRIHGRTDVRFLVNGAPQLITPIPTREIF
jgi:hypothetical protein